MMETAVFREVG